MNPFLLALGISCVGSISVSAQEADDSAAWSRSLLDRYKPLEEYFTSVQIEELSRLALRKTAGIEDPKLRTRMLGDIQTFVAENYMSVAFVHLAPEREGAAELAEKTIYTPSAWQLFQYDLEKRIEHGISRPKHDAGAAGVSDQIEQLTRAARARLSATFSGPGAEEFVNSAVGRFGRALQYRAESSLEFGFERPLSAEQFGKVESGLRIFVPEGAGTNKSVLGGPNQDPSHVFIGDAKAPPMLASDIADFQMFLQARKLIESFSIPEGFYDAKYKELTERMILEMKGLSKELDQEAERRWAIARANRSLKHAGDGEGALRPSPAPGEAPEETPAPSSRKPALAELAQSKGLRIVVVVGVLGLLGIILMRRSRTG
jgi:hypothetical protein